ncbi:hypothetical protein [Sinimarinibacterium flocculans]|uniref:hypothetical protein n=1 Tax=Sinimarinibacterium flocculans TaxID=985250 RepID=UPI003517A14C
MSTEQKDIRALENALSNIDAMSQSGFSRIAAMAKLALLSLETPQGYNHVSEIGTVLQAIVYIARETEDEINAAAECHGCNYIDKAERRRMDGLSAYRTGGAQ